VEVVDPQPVVLLRPDGLGLGLGQPREYLFDEVLETGFGGADPLLDDLRLADDRI